jgi:hypothetical protein
MNDFENIKMKFGNEFWDILFRDYISPNLFAVYDTATTGLIFIRVNIYPGPGGVENF